MIRGEAWEHSNEVMPTTHLHLVQRIRMSEAYLHFPIRLYGVDRDNVTFTFRKSGALERKVLSLVFRALRGDLLHFTELFV
jgi:hypothetical protein